MSMSVDSIVIALAKRPVRKHPVLEGLSLLGPVRILHQCCPPTSVPRRSFTASVASCKEAVVLVAQLCDGLAAMRQSYLRKK